MSHEFQRFLQKEGIHHRISTPHTPQQNSVAKRKNRTLLNMARSMLQFVQLSPQFWEEAIDTACTFKIEDFIDLWGYKRLMNYGMVTNLT